MKLVEVGSRVRMVGLMDDSLPLPVGTEGVVRGVNELCAWAQYDVEWENGSRLMLLDTDPFIVL